MYALEDSSGSRARVLRSAKGGRLPKQLCTLRARFAGCLGATDEKGCRPGAARRRAPGQAPTASRMHGMTEVKMSSGSLTQMVEMKLDRARWSTRYESRG